MYDSELSLTKYLCGGKACVGQQPLGYKRLVGVAIFLRFKINQVMWFAYGDG